MNKNANLRKQIKDFIESDKVEPTKKKKFKSPTLRLGPSEVNVKIKDLRILLQEDIKKSADKPLGNPWTRDISHLQDKKTPTSISLPILPTDIQVLRKMKSSEFKSFHTPSRCKRENCIENALFGVMKVNEIDTIERMLIGNPTGRQDIKELCTWFSSMLETHQDSDIDTIMLIYETCAKELTRQVTVQCIERGELLQILFTYQPDILKRKIEELQKDIQKLKISHSNEIDTYKSKIKKLTKDLTEKNLLIQKILLSSKKEKKKISDELNRLKLRYNEFVRKYNDEEKIWKNKHINLLVKLRDSFTSKGSLLGVGGKVATGDANGAGGLVQVDAGYIISQEIMEYEAALNKGSAQAEIVLESQDDLDVGKLLEIYECEVREETDLMEIQGQGIEENILEKLNNQGLVENQENNEYGIQTLLDTHETFIQQNADKETLTDPLEFSVVTQDSCSVFPCQPTFVIQISQESSLGVFPDDSSELNRKSISDAKDQIDPELQKMNESLILIHQDLQEKKLSEPFLQVQKPKKSKRKPFKPTVKKSSEKPKNKEIELQQTIETLKQQLQEKTEKINEIFSVKSNIPTNNSENLKLSLGKYLLRGSLNPTPNLSTPRDSSALVSPTFLLTSEVSPRDSVFFGSDSGKSAEIEGFYDNLIPTGCDLYSWKTGFSSGFEQGKKEGFKEGEILGAEEKELESTFKDKDEKIEEVEEKNEDDQIRSTNRTLSRGVSLRTELFRKKVKDITKIIQFQFYRPGTQKKQHPVYALISRFMMKTKESVLSNCSLSRKIINKLIGSTFMNCLSKIRTGDHIENLIEQVYDDFYQKYGLKAVSEKRFIEFLSSLFTYTGFRRVSMFIKFLGCGGKIQLKSYSRLSFLYYLGALSMMINLKIGVMVAFDEIADKQLFPTQRGVECAKDKLEWFLDKDKLNLVLGLIHEKSEQDTKGVNPAGLIELEFVLELIVDHYEEYQQQVESGLIAVCTAFGFESIVCNYEFLMIIRHVSYERLDFSEDESKSESLKKINFSGLLRYIDAKDSFTLNEVSSKCVFSNFLKIDDIYRFLPKPKDLDSNTVFEEIMLKKAQLEGIASEIGNAGAKFKTLDSDQFIDRIRKILDQFNAKEPYYSLLAFKLLESELKRVKAEP